ncbi:protein phosphatase 2C domain-containing protein [Planococcus sp. YIM B11945]|uniref:protein phosphatase 2C domain-containing protein n=1 Tax=Planococcus sp. YIM B11945 TaxID=3435410 RepID=UPI003D7F119F
MGKNEKAFSWVGSQELFVDQADIQQIHNIVIGRFGGNSSAGQSKNEDGCLIWLDEENDWEFAMVLDAHNTAESAEKVVGQFEQYGAEVKNLLNEPLHSAFFRKLEEQVLAIFQSEEFLQVCRQTQGETACMIVVRKGKYVWWLSVGDCLLYLFHKELAEMGQYELNQRHFYEWVGQVNTFDQLVPCFSTGTAELRTGKNQLFVTTDGLIECPGEPFTDPEQLAGAFDRAPHAAAVESLLETIQKYNVRDSTTIVSWQVVVKEKATRPSNG